MPSFLGFNSSLITASNSISYLALNSLCQDSCVLLSIKGSKAVKDSFRSAKTATVVFTFLSISDGSISK